MYQVSIKLADLASVKKIASIANGFPFGIQLQSGKYTVDAKSIMGIFSLDLAKPIILTAEAEDAKLKEELSPFLTQE